MYLPFLVCGLKVYSEVLYLEGGTNQSYNYLALHNVTANTGTEVKETSKLLCRHFLWAPGVLGTTYVPFPL